MFYYLKWKSLKNWTCSFTCKYCIKNTIQAMLTAGLQANISCWMPSETLLSISHSTNSSLATITNTSSTSTMLSRSSDS